MGINISLAPIDGTMIEMDDDLRKALSNEGLYLDKTGAVDGQQKKFKGMWAYYLIIGGIYNEHTPGSLNHRPRELERILDYSNHTRVDWDNPHD